MYSFILLEEGMATHSRILAWRITRKEEPGGLQSMGSQRVRHDWAAKHGIEHSFILLLTAFGFFPGVGFIQWWYYEHSWTNLLKWLSTHWSQEWGHILYIYGRFSQIRPNTFPRACTDLDSPLPVLWVSSSCSESSPALSDISLSMLAIVVPRWMSLTVDLTEVILMLTEPEYHFHGGVRHLDVQSVSC